LEKIQSIQRFKSLGTAELTEEDDKLRIPYFEIQKEVEITSQEESDYTMDDMDMDNQKSKEESDEVYLQVYTN
jgi:hypothetical protein